MRNQNKRTKDRQNGYSTLVSESKANMAFNSAMQQIDLGNYERALSMLQAAGRDLLVRNAYGVCLMRLSRPQPALGVLREVALQPGCTWVRKDAPPCYIVNYATALLLAGHPAGCLEILAEVDPKLPSVQRIRGAIRRWESTLTWWQWLNWKLGRIEPETEPATLDFPPGEFTHNVTRSEGPPAGSSDDPQRTAA